MKNLGQKIAEKTINAEGIKVEVHVKNDLAYLSYLLNEINITSATLQEPYSAESNMTIAEYLLSKQELGEVSQTEAEAYLEKHARKRIKKLVKIALNEAIEYGYALDLADDFKKAVDEISCDIYDNCEGGEDRSSTEIIAITFGLINAHDLIRADKISRIKPSK